MKVEENIAQQLARETCSRISRKVRTTLQQMQDCRLSGDDSGLKNTWDEICVQVQFDHFLAWDAYEETVIAIVEGDVESLQSFECQAIWLQTDSGWNWKCKDNNIDLDNAPVVEDEVVDHIIREYVYREAGNWTNEQIRKYLERSARTD